MLCEIHRGNKIAMQMRVIGYILQCTGYHNSNNSRIVLYGRSELRLIQAAKFHFSQEMRESVTVLAVKDVLDIRKLVQIIDFQKESKQLMFLRITLNLNTIK